MISIIEKDGATIITIEKASSDERSLIQQAKKLRDTPQKSAEKANMFANFKCNQGKKYPQQEEEELRQAAEQVQKTVDKLKPVEPSRSAEAAETITPAAPIDLGNLDDYEEILGLEDV